MQVNIFVAGDDNSIGWNLCFLQIYFQIAANLFQELGQELSTSVLVVFKGLILIVNGALVFNALQS